MKRAPEYESWAAMRKRCLNARHPSFRLYGARGIRICDRWASSFVVFLADVGPRPAAGYSLDRIDARGHYEPGNVRWATWKEQNRHISRNRMIEANGERLCAAEWAERLGLHPSAIFKRIASGWTPERAVTVPKGGAS